VKRLFAGIDGGQSSTTAVVGDETGRILGCGRAGAADEVGAGPVSTRLHDALRQALSDACSNAGLSTDTWFEAIVAGVSGYEGRVYGKSPELPATRVLLVHDALIAHAGALAGKAGVVVIAGTGSVVYATGEQFDCTTGGWGFLFGDEGSAFWIVREALAALMRRQDERCEPPTDEMQAACNFFGLPSLRRIARAFYAGELTRDRLAAFSTTALGFESFREIADRGADRLAARVQSSIEAGAAPAVACVGGVFGDARFKERLVTAVRMAVPQACFVDSKYEPSTGALLLAYREAGIDASSGRDLRQT
jgi:N-acetylglucosamine kinase-like BadF-type ATPase